ncbi:MULTISPECIES: fatty acid--CoA ligase [Streptomyces]|uniref:Fatty acid--CoA ligase n=1 Tax=Streptomyces doudnae TaxID=3075536 RepID=A0ABD5EXD4_9ACTN|nr:MULTISPECIES: fatty acid--CoA ligase [unclassified Streptomyces]MDT0438279.1 fatty acid--CoA ligase [Streptomyces sp. DSM 41981]MYQ65147.1 long-chain-fatty-acid--CoA ligase [Streptomyces sp. SID4950]
MPVIDKGSWTLHRTSRDHAGARPHHPAIVCDDRTVDYLTLHRESNRAAWALRAAGVRRGDRVAYLGHESEYYYLVILACVKVGAVLVPVNWRLTPPEVDHILRDSGAVLLFVGAAFRERGDEVRGRLPGLRGTVPVDGGDAAAPEPGAGLLAWSAGHPDTDHQPDTGPDDPAVQIYTSGTTGMPKGAVLAHRSFFTLPHAMRERGVAWIDWLPDDVALISLPGFGIAGIGWFMHTFNAGGTSVVMPQFDPQEAVRLIRARRVTTTFAAPAMLQAMLGERTAEPAAFTSLRKIAYGAAPMSETLLKRCLEMFGCEFAQIYASTETGSVAVCLPPEDHHRGDGALLRTVGLPCPGNEVKVIGPDGAEVAPGTIGEVCVRAPSRMLGYWNLPEATGRTLVGEWVHMGDAGYLDDDGYLHLCDRMNDTIIVAGQNIYPAEVEKALAAHPAVEESAVVGLPHPRWGEAVHACVVLRPGATATPRDLLLSLRGRLADYKTPAAYHFVPSLPHNPSGKILRRSVREELSARLDRAAGGAEVTAGR